MDVSTTADNNIVFFDGICNLCNHTVSFLIAHNDAEDLYFSSLQSAFAAHFLKNYPTNAQQLSTIYFFKDGQLYQKSAAVMQIAKHLNKPYQYFSIFSFVPTKFSNRIYDFIAKNRYRWFGKSNTCRVPTAIELNRFVEVVYGGER